jgi:two-component system, cell cycle response regulator
MLDIDHFKDLNDRFGHQAGDDVLVDLARRIGAMVRASDTVARWGGEEFLLLTPETPIGDAQRLAEMIRRHVADNSLAGRYQVTVSARRRQLPARRHARLARGALRRRALPGEARRAQPGAARDRTRAPVD